MSRPPSVFAGRTPAGGRHGSGPCRARAQPGSESSDGGNEGHAGEHQVPGTAQRRQPLQGRRGVGLTRAEGRKSWK